MDLRLSPSGPDVGGIEQMPLRTAQDNSTLAVALTLTTDPVDVNAALRAELAGPFDPSHRFSAECDIDFSNASTNILATVQLHLQVSVDGGAFTTVHTEEHNIGPNGPSNVRQVQPVSLHLTPQALALFDPTGEAETLAVRIAAETTAGETGTVIAESLSGQWLRFTEHSAP